MSGVRIDKWLWAARFFKTRGLATEMVHGGHVQLNGERVKPAKAVQVGDVLSVVREQETFEVTVTGLAEKRGSAAVAQGLYEELAASVVAREKQRELRKLDAASGPAPKKRPDKKSRRQIIRFVRRES